MAFEIIFLEIPQDIGYQNMTILICLGGGSGRRKGLKIPRPLVAVRVQVSSRAPKNQGFGGVGRC
jgi:hypothetical protein